MAIAKRGRPSKASKAKSSYKADYWSSLSPRQYRKVCQNISNGLAKSWRKRRRAAA